MRMCVCVYVHAVHIDALSDLVIVQTPYSVSHLLSEPVTMLSF